MLAGLHGWLAPGNLATPRQEVVPELSFIWMAKERLLQGGSLSEWVPFEFAGFPMVKYMSYALYDGVAAASIVTGLSLEVLYKIAFIAAFLASAIAFYEYARSLTKNRGAALVGGAIYGLFPFHLQVTSETWVHALFWVVLPLVFLAYEKSRQRPVLQPRDGLIMGVLLASLPIINSEHTILLAPFLAIYVLLRDGALIARARVAWRRVLRYWALAGLVGIGLAAFFVLPGALEMKYVGIQLKQGGESFQSQALLRDYAVSPALIVRAIATRLGLQFNIQNPPVLASAFWSIAWYPGLVAMALVGLGLIRGWRDGRFRAHLALLALGVLFVLGGWLSWNPIPHLPVLGRLVPFRDMIFLAFFGAACAAWGAAWLLDRILVRQWLAVGALLIFVIGDQWAATSALRTVPSYFADDELAAYQWLADQGDQFRTWELLATPRDAYLRSYALAFDNGRHAWGYYDNGAPRQIWALYNWGDVPTALGLSSTRYVLTRPDGTGSAENALLFERLQAAGYRDKVWESEHVTIWEDPDWQPMVRAYATSALYLGDPEYRALDILPTLVQDGVALVSGPSDYANAYSLEDASEFDYVIVREPWARGESLGATWSSALAGNMIRHADILQGATQLEATQIQHAPEITWTRPGPEEIAVNITSTSPTTVMVSEAWYPNWRAYIDGQPAPAWRVNYAFLGARVPAGYHQIVFRYVKPWYVWVGYAITACTALALVAVAIASLYTKRLPAHPAP